MANLSTIDKDRLEDFLEMQSGYVLSFSDRTFTDFFKRFNIDINDSKYNRNGTSKAKRLRTFWDTEGDSIVGRVLSEMLEYASYLNHKHPNLNEEEKKRRAVKYESCKSIVERLQGERKTSEHRDDGTLASFLTKNWGDISFDRLDLDPTLEITLSNRAGEALKCLHYDLPLSCIILCGSMLEGLLLHVASRQPREFNAAACAPKHAGKVKPFHNWTLSQLIDAAHESGYLREDVKKFSHTLREYRNYVHPHQQMLSNFTPDKITAEICLQVLKLSIVSLRVDKPIA